MIILYILQLKNDGNALQYASERLQNDFNIVINAVRNNRDALQYASLELQSSEFKDLLQL